MSHLTTVVTENLFFFSVVKFIKNLFIWITVKTPWQWQQWAKLKLRLHGVGRLLNLLRSFVWVVVRTRIRIRVRVRLTHLE